MSHDPSLDFVAIRERLAASKGRDYWRGLDELADSPEFQHMLHREFPERASEWLDSASRRKFLKVMGASIALAGANGCGFGENRHEKLVPPVRMAEYRVAGNPQYFATAISLGGYATGALVESHEGRPTKVEGNDLHPASLGACDVFTQSAVLSLYDPDRSKLVLRESSINTMTAFLADLNRALERQQAAQGVGVRILTETVGSPTLGAQIQAFLKKYPSAKWVQYEPVNRDAARAGAIRAFGEDVEVRYDFTKADVVLSLDGDFLTTLPGSLKYARDFASRRALPDASMNRLYAVETTPTLSGAMADHRIGVPPSQVEPLVRAIASAVGATPASGSLSESQTSWVAAVAKDLKAHGGSSIVVPGPSQSALVHALAHAMNQALGNVGKTVVYTEPALVRSDDQTSAFRDLVKEMSDGRVELLVILGGNPAYTAPADVDFAKAVRKVERAIHLSLYEDETSALCRWHVNATHVLEMWGDAHAFDGTASIVQPLTAPLYGGMSPYELMQAMLDQPEITPLDAVRNHWKAQKLGGDDFEAAWEKAVHDGIIEGTALAPKSVTMKTLEDLPGGETASPGSPNALEIIFRPDPTIWDGRFANNGWLQELPKPLTKLTWDNAALVSPAMAERLGLSNNDRVELRLNGRSVVAPVWIFPGHADHCVTAHLGYGQTKCGQVAEGTGYNAYLLRSSNAMNSAPGLEIRKVGGTYLLACTQMHRTMEGRDIVRTAPLSQFLAEPDFAKRHADHIEKDDSLYEPYPYEGYAWGMAVNLNACIGCNACIIGCQSENNIPVVGKEQVYAQREMHWIEIDRYYSGSLDDPETHFQPRMCQHCENAPCEVVCPVAATSHSAEGLNEMTYNRCVGTRYCSNNCPYKVRHFNFFDYTKDTPPSLVVLNNPDVTVRSRGVMEKCTYCVQRINGARQQAKVEGREIREGEIVTACQSACPTRSIVFGNINDPASEVSRLKGQPLEYGLLADLNTRPRTTYLARVTNPNREITPEEEAHGQRSH